MTNYMDYQLGIDLVIKKLEKLKEPVTPEFYIEIKDEQGKELTLLTPSQPKRKNMCKIMGFSNYVYNQTFQDPQSASANEKKFKLGFLQIIMEKSDNTTLITNKYNTTESLERIQILIPAAKDDPDSEDKPVTKQVYIFQNISIAEITEIAVEDSKKNIKYYKVFSFKYLQFAMKNTLYDPKTQDSSGNIYSMFKDT